MLTHDACATAQIVQRINNAFVRADQIQHAEGQSTGSKVHWFAPIIADAEAGFGGNLNAYELVSKLRFTALCDSIAPWAVTTLICLALCSDEGHDPSRRSSRAF